MNNRITDRGGKRAQKSPGVGFFKLIRQWNPSFKYTLTQKFITIYYHSYHILHITYYIIAYEKAGCAVEKSGDSRVPSPKPSLTFLLASTTVPETPV